jgi:hypothetical protein
MEPNEIYLAPFDTHIFFYGKAVDLVIASKSASSLHEVLDDPNLYEFIGSLARILERECGESFEFMQKLKRGEV